MGRVGARGGVGDGSGDIVGEDGVECEVRLHVSGVYRSNHDKGRTLFFSMNSHAARSSTTLLAASTHQHCIRCQSHQARRERTDEYRLARIIQRGIPSEIHKVVGPIFLGRVYICAVLRIVRSDAGRSEHDRLDALLLVGRSEEGSRHVFGSLNDAFIVGPERNVGREVLHALNAYVSVPVLLQQCRCETYLLAYGPRRPHWQSHPLRPTR